MVLSLELTGRIAQSGHHQKQGDVVSERLEASLMNQAKKKGLKGKAKDKYVYGTLTKVAGPKGSQQAARTGNVRKQA